jgi:hypothetical protein
LIAPGARNKERCKDGNEEPSQPDEFENRRRAAHAQINRKSCQSGNAAQEPWSDEGAVARGRQYILLCRRVHQPRNIVLCCRNEAHDLVCTPGFADALPIFLLSNRVRGRLSEH